MKHFQHTSKLLLNCLMEVTIITLILTGGVKAQNVENSYAAYAEAIGSENSDLAMSIARAELLKAKDADRASWLMRLAYANWTGDRNDKANALFAEACKQLRKSKVEQQELIDECLALRA